MMSREELTYLAVLLGSLPVGFLLKDRGPRWRQFGGAAVGAGLALLTCGPHVLHSLGTVLGTWAILIFLPRCSGGASLAWAFGYLLFFRTPWVWGLPEPPPYANALQLLVTLKMVSLGCDVQELREAGIKGVTSQETRLMIGSLRRVPSLIDILCYSYCYLGLLTGPFYRLGTHLDWVWGVPCGPTLGRALSHARWAPALAALGALVGRAWPADTALQEDFGDKPWLARLALMVPVFLALRMRLYVGWLCAESGCVAAGMGLYPKSARAKPGQGPTVPWERPKTCTELPPEQWDFEAIRTVDPWGTELGRRFRGGLRRWNMTVQWWLAAYVHRRGPRAYPVLRNAWTMLASAYWHGLHGGQHLSFLSVPLWLAAEAEAESALKAHFGVPLEELGGTRGAVLRGVQWLLKMRAFEYLSMGFVLRGARPTLRFWASVYFCLHVLPLGILLVAVVVGKRARKKRGVGGEKGGKGRGMGGEMEGKKWEMRGEKVGKNWDMSGEREGKKWEESGEKAGKEREMSEEKVGKGKEMSEEKAGKGREMSEEKAGKEREMGEEKERKKWEESGEKVGKNWDMSEEKEGKKWDMGEEKAGKEREMSEEKAGKKWEMSEKKAGKKWEMGEEKVPLNHKIQEGGNPINPKIQEGCDALNPKIQEGGNPINPKICEGGDPINPKIKEGENPLNPKIQEGGNPINPKIQDRWNPLNPKIQEGWDPQNPKIRG